MLSALNSVFALLFSFAFAFASSIADYPDPIPITCAAFRAGGRAKLLIPQQRSGIVSFPGSLKNRELSVPCSGPASR